MKKFILGILVSTIAFTGFAQEEISGVTPASKIKVEGQELVFNGAGLREKFFLDLYVGALYVTNKSSDPVSIMNADESMAITLDIVSGLINSEKMINAINEGFEKLAAGNAVRQVVLFD
jgi:5-deoxy-D-glucuronate isomerase